MKLLLSIALILFATNTALAKNKYKDITTHSSDTPKKRLSRSEIMDRLSVTASVYVTSADGTQLFHDVTEMRAWNLNGKENFESTWMSDSDEFGTLAMKQKWFLNKNNQLIVNIQQFEVDFSTSNANEPPKLGKMTSNKDMVITEFSPFTIDIKTHGDKKTVVRFVPSLRKKEKESDQIGNFPIKGTEMVVFDNKGKVWAESVSFSGKFISLKTHQGTIYFSFFPFKGSKDMGVAENGKIGLKLNKKHRLNLISSTPFLPQGVKAKVYGAVNFKNKGKKLRSVRVGTTDKEDQFKF